MFAIRILVLRDIVWMRAIIESLLYAMDLMILDAMEAKSHLVMISGTVLKDCGF